MKNLTSLFLISIYFIIGGYKLTLAQNSDNYFMVPAPAKVENKALPPGYIKAVDISLDKIGPNSCGSPEPLSYNIYFWMMEPAMLSQDVKFRILPTNPPMPLPNGYIFEFTKDALVHSNACGWILPFNIPQEWKPQERKSIQLLIQIAGHDDPNYLGTNIDGGMMIVIADDGNGGGGGRGETRSRVLKRFWKIYDEPKPLKRRKSAKIAEDLLLY